jgi:hypothetical protein
VAPPATQRPVLEIDFTQTSHARTLKERCGEALQSGSTSEVSLQFPKNLGAEKIILKLITPPADKINREPGPPLCMLESSKMPSSPMQIIIFILCPTNQKKSCKFNVSNYYSSARYKIMVEIVFYSHGGVILRVIRLKP